MNPIGLLFLKLHIKMKAFSYYNNVLAKNTTIKYMIGYKNGCIRRKIKTYREG